MPQDEKNHQGQEQAHQQGEAPPMSNSLKHIALIVGILYLGTLPTGTASAEACPNAQFRTGPSAHLPDCRAYELVTPPYKNDGNIQTFLVSPEGADGPTVVFGSDAGFAGIASNNGTTAKYRLGRTEGGWGTTPLNLSAGLFTGFFAGTTGDVFGFSENVDRSVWVEREAGESDRALDFFREDPEGSVEDIGTALPPSAPEGTPEEVGKAAGVFPAGVSADGSRVLFEINSSFWPGDGTQSPFHSLYEYVGTCASTAVACEGRQGRGEARREPLLVGVSDGKTVVNGVTLPVGQQISECGTELGAGDPKGDSLDSGVGMSHNAVSGDGKTVFFTAYPAGATGTSCAGVAPPVAEVYARVETASGVFATVAISEPSVTDCSACDTSKGVLRDAEFMGASADGSKVFFETTQPLLGGDSSENVYEYDFDAPAGERVVRVSGGDATMSGVVAGVQGFPVQVSEDGSHVYFVAQGVLTRAANVQGDVAVLGADNLYVYERDERYPMGRTSFIADLCSGAGVSGGEQVNGVATISGGVADGRCPSGQNRLVANLAENRNDLRLWALGDLEVQGGADVTSDGRFLVFTSYGDLTPDDTSSARQVFEYDAQTGVLVRVSIGQAGFNDDGNTAVSDAEVAFPKYWLGGVYEADAYRSRLTVSEDGSYVFFESGDGLTKEALDNVQIGEKELGSGAGVMVPVYANNVYEYHDGVVSLISDGHDVAGGSKSAVDLFGTDASGSDVFFTTSDELVGQDTDEQEDFYDARIGGGFPAPSVAVTCAGEACQGALSAAPTLLSPGSEFQAGANPPLAALTSTVRPKPKSKPKSKPAKCKRGFVKRHRKCVKQRAKKSTRGKGGKK
jgi:hypothetical protein